MREDRGLVRLSPPISPVTFFCRRVVFPPSIASSGLPPVVGAGESRSLFDV